MYIQVNIGRNVGDVPMSDNRWSTFKSAIEQAIRSNVVSEWTGDVSGLSIERHEGTGVWAGSEDSAHISMYDERGFWIEALRNDLRAIRTAYGQDAIALIVGSELI